MTDWPALLEGDLQWREAELASLKRIAITNSGNEVTLRATLRAGWAMLYAHFEGFTKFCWELLLDQGAIHFAPVATFGCGLLARRPGERTERGRPGRLAEEVGRRAGRVPGIAGD